MGKALLRLMIYARSVSVFRVQRQWRSGKMPGMPNTHETEPLTKPEQPGTPRSTDTLVTVAEPPPVKEIGGRSGPEPTRFGDWEKNGRCIDF
jgi:hypothetical protein